MFFMSDEIVSVAQSENATQLYYVFFFRDDSYQTGNKGSVTMNKKKSLSVRGLQSLDTRQKQLYAAGAVATSNRSSLIRTIV